MNSLELKAKEFGSQLLVTNKMLNDAANEERLRTILRMTVDGGARWLTAHGMQAVEIEQDYQRDVSLRAYEYLMLGEAIPEFTSLALIAQQDHKLRNQQEVLLAVNDLSWWKFLWLKLRGKRLVDTWNP